MNDFASSAMLRLIQLGLQRQGLDAPMPPARERGAHVPLAHKRALLDELLRVHGPRVLLRIGEAVADARDEPVSVALSMAREPHDLIERWKRLERFVHSRHRVLVEASDERRLVLRHVSRDPRMPPTRAEDLLVLGLLVALLHRLGTLALQARFEGETQWRWRAGGWRDDAPLPPDVSRWFFSWQPAVHSTAMAAAGDEDTVARAHRLLCADAGRHWSVQTLARDMGMSPRSLQRRLAEGGSSFSELVSSVRLGMSAKLLVQTQQPPAQIAYVCGFADQGHFNRAFKRLSALTPGQYRHEFAANADPSALRAQ
ncbi:Urease operon transcriptional activator [Burkholderiaceae bacterium]|nr:Urease operon transcriptional activator [Burkholderiaceae bacterium]